MKKALIWGAWLTLTLAASAFFANKLFGEGDKSAFLIGEATHGHHQIEMACTTCHSEPFGGNNVLQNACMQCHAEELKEAHDSHPKSKFTDPRNADRISVIDARYCIACHIEHQLEYTRAMGVTLPDDYCFHCHEDLGKERPSHQDLPFDSCASAGCHNYHDNRALYEDFLVENAGQPWLKMPADQITLEPTAVTRLEKQPVVDTSSSRFIDRIQRHPAVAQQWQHSSHARAGVDCGGCHSTQSDPTRWIEKPDYPQCGTCHKNEAAGFLAGKHGMRLAESVVGDLPPIKPADGRLDFKENSLHIEQSCSSCHGAHEFSREFAKTDACLSCHDDQHSRAFPASAHAKLHRNAAAGAEVTCATCHMPRLETQEGTGRVFAVQHNQNWNLRPSEKMIRSVCMNCHGLQFSLDALADPVLILNNFDGQPTIIVPSVEWALQRAGSDNQKKTP